MNDLKNNYFFILLSYIIICIENKYYITIASLIMTFISSYYYVLCIFDGLVGPDCKISITFKTQNFSKQKKDKNSWMTLIERWIITG